MTKPIKDSSHKKIVNLRLVFTGLSMGLADLIPGVSSGTIAFLYGIYDELLLAINTITGKSLKLFLKLKIKESIKSIPFSFVIPLFVGMIFSIFTMSNAIKYLLENQPLLIWSLFFGFVLGSAFMIRNRVKLWGVKEILFLAFSCLITFLLVGLPSANIAPSPIVVFFSGIIGSIAMILPGISGSLILVLIGQYKNIIDAIIDKDLLTLFIFATGIIIGVSVFARLLTWLLSKHHNTVMVVLIGIILGSLRSIWPWKGISGEVNLLNHIFVPIMLIITGFIFVFLLEKFGITKEHNDDISND